MKVFIGGAWPYANNSLHVGHLAALLPGDVIARYYRKTGADVVYVSGTDSHGTPITVRAKQENINPKVIASTYHKEFEENFKDLQFTYDFYTTTMTDYHKLHVQKYFLELIKNGYIYPKEEEQDYCLSCDIFLSDREVIGICPHCGEISKGDQCDSCFATLNASELSKKKCSDCGELTTTKLNNHLYFSLSKFQKEIEKLLNKNKDRWKSNAINETIKYLNNGLHDRASTRQLDWGIDTPVDGYADKKIYVWFEAVLGYLTAAKYVLDQHDLDFDNYFKNNNELVSYYIHGKDNIPFHTIIYPALLLALDKDFNLPDYIISSNYVNVNNEKISKSKGNGVTVPELLEHFNADTIRFYMLSSAPETRDTNFSLDMLVQSHNKHLVGEYGNFVNRNLAFIDKKFNGVIEHGLVDKKVASEIQTTYDEVGEYIKKGEMRNALSKAFSLVQFSNKYYDSKKPWVQVKSSLEDFNNTTYNCVLLMINIANILEPFIPESTTKVKEMLHITENTWNLINVPKDLVLNKVEVLFSRIDLKQDLQIKR